MNNTRLEKWGHTLIMKNPPKRCSKCGINLVPPFQFCKEFEKGFCENCEKGTSKRLCYSMEEEHEHFNIIKIEDES